MNDGAAVLFHWRRDIEVDIRIIMRAQGLTDLSTPACKTWAREFIRSIVPWWEPGVALPGVVRQNLGAVFEARLADAKQERDKLAWQKR